MSNDTKIFFKNIKQKKEKNYKSIIGNFSIKNSKWRLQTKC